MPRCDPGGTDSIADRSLTDGRVTRPLRPADRRRWLKGIAAADTDAVTGDLIKPIRLADLEPVIQRAGDTDERHAGRPEGRQQVGRPRRGSDRAKATQLNPQAFGTTRFDCLLDDPPLPGGRNEQEVGGWTHGIFSRLAWTADSRFGACHSIL